MYHCYSYDEVEAKKGMRISETSPTPTTNYSAGMNNTTKKTTKKTPLSNPYQHQKACRQYSGVRIMIQYTLGYCLEDFIYHHIMQLITKDERSE